jgi:hypothetical protein
VRYVFDVPDGVGSIETRLPDSVTVTNTEGFTAARMGRYRWDEETAAPSITYTTGVNETVDASGPEGFEGDYLFVDTGSWALVRRPQIPVSWTWTGGQPVGFERRATVDGEGYVGGLVAYLGAHDTYTRTAHGQRFHLVVPTRATLAESPANILSGLSNASDQLRVGDRDRDVHVIAAPTTSVQWGVRGLQTGDTAMWVRDAEHLDVADNTWFHEYAHARQGFTTEASARWLTEATATYYGALLALESGHVGFESFREFLGRGAVPPQSEVVLTDPSTWTNAANYWKGALVVGALDRRIRLATDRTRSFGAVFSRLNAHDGQVDGDDFLAATETTAGSEVAGTAATYSGTTAVPETWSAADHQNAFGATPARFTYRFGPPPGDGGDGTFTVAGPYRNGSVAGSPIALYPGETLEATVSVANAGGASASYDGIFSVDGADRSSVTGTLAPGETATRTVSHTFTATGEHTVSFGADTVTVRVYDPATAGIANVTLDPRSLDSPGTVTVIVRVVNDLPVPATRAVTVTRDNETVANRTVRLGPDSARTVSIPVELAERGEYRIGVANAGEATVSVGGGPFAVGPGFGPLAALVALAVCLVLLASRRDR